jgi:excinuclease UvrABC ATPase subunit
MKIDKEIRRMLNYRQDIAEYLHRHNRTVEEEVKLIEEKKSGLTTSQRNYVLTYFESEVIEEPIATTISKQYCPTCKKETMHTPKLGLAPYNKRLCEVCRTVNEVK